MYRKAKDFAYGLLLAATEIYQTSNIVHPQCCIFKTSRRWRSYPRKAPHIMNNHWPFIYDTTMHRLPVNLFFICIYLLTTCIHSLSFSGNQFQLYS